MCIHLNMTLLFFFVQQLFSVYVCVFLSLLYISKGKNFTENKRKNWRENVEGISECSCYI